MKVLYNNKGIALVFTLFIITIFTILGLFIISLSISNTKQIHVSEENSKSVDLAEMGITYYDELINIAVKSTIEEMKQIILKDHDGGNLRSENAYKQMTVTNLYDKITFFNNNYDIQSKIVNLSRNDKYTIEVNEFKKDNINYSLTLNINSIGSSQDEEKIISSIIDISLLDISINPTTGEAEFGADILASISEPKNLPSCSIAQVEFGTKNCIYLDQNVISYHPVGNFNNRSIVVNGNFTGDKAFNQGISNSILYIKGKGSFNNPINGLHYSKIYVGKDASFDNINQGIIQSTILVKGTATFNQPISLNDKAILYIGKNASFKNINDLKNNSLIIVKGSVDFTDNINGFSNSTIYVEGNANFHYRHINSYQTSAKICVKGNISNLPNMNNYRVYSPSINATAFSTNCSDGEGDSELNAENILLKIESIIKDLDYVN